MCVEKKDKEGKVKILNGKKKGIGKDPSFQEPFNLGMAPAQ